MKTLPISSTVSALIALACFGAHIISAQAQQASSTNSQTSISANVTYHLKIVIADANDSIVDSAMFIKAQIPCP